MSIKATRLVPTRPVNQYRRCDRCGVDWRDSKGRFIREAPCQSCREVLADLDGIPRAYWVREAERSAFDWQQYNEWLKTQAPQGVDERQAVSA